MKYRLALYSDQESAENQSLNTRLMALIGKARPLIGYLSSSPDPNRQYFAPARAQYADLGADMILYMDEHTCSDPERLEALFACDAVHLSGGNTFGFLAWLRRAGLTAKLRQYASQGNVLVGVSAGAILMTPTIETALLCGDDVSLSDGNSKGLGFVPFWFWPHYLPGAEHRDEARPYLPHAGLTYGCPDGSGIIIEGQSLELYGSVRTFAAHAAR